MKNRIPVTLLLLCLVSVIPAFAQERCWRVQLEDPPQWPSSGVAIGDGFLLVDAARNKLLRYDLGGALHGSRSGGDVFQFVNIQKWRTGFLVQDVGPIYGGDLLFFDADLVPRSQISVLEKARRSGAEVRSLFSWQVVGDQLFSISDVRVEDDQWETWLVGAPLSDLASFRNVLKQPLDAETRDFYLFGLHLLASADSHAVALLLDQNPALLEIIDTGLAERRPLVGLFPGLARRVPLDYERSPEGIKAAYRRLSQLTLPQGVWADGRYVYLLVRTGSRTSRTAGWVLLTLAPSGEVLRKTPLPTQAPHLLVVPGERHWFVLERGRVEALGRQKSDSVLVLHSDLLSDVNAREPSLVEMGSLCRSTYQSRP